MAGGRRRKSGARADRWAHLRAWGAGIEERAVPDLGSAQGWEGGRGGWGRSRDGKFFVVG
jgi:hypothetical protein